ncbi:hypothetical protein QVD99_001830 [Batrachochytrium dendrobatidis]|nr:hypothetical protein O5D80_000474 [Batrachochytrium dendrobatidis]KAK5672013.1 hypothetical protein QVD99_001830 [Batrachochytrium dendrobatidis]
MDAPTQLMDDVSTNDSIERPSHSGVNGKIPITISTTGLEHSQQQPSTSSNHMPSSTSTATTLSSSIHSAGSLPLIHLSKMIDPSLPEYKQIQTSREEILKLLDMTIPGDDVEVAATTHSLKTTPSHSSMHDHLNTSIPSVSAMPDAISHDTDTSCSQPTYKHHSIGGCVRVHQDNDGDLDSFNDDNRDACGNDYRTFSYSNQKTRYHHAPSQGGICLNAHQRYACARLLRNLKVYRAACSRTNQDEIDDFVQQELDAALSIIKELVEAKSAHENELEKIRNDYSTLYSYHDNLKADNDDLQVNRDTLRDERDGLVAAIEQSNADLKRAKIAATQSVSELTVAKTQLADRETYIQSLERQLQLSTEVRVPCELTSSVAPVDNAVSDSAADMTAAQHVIWSLQQELQVLQNAYETMKQQSETTEARQISKASECEQLSQLVSVYEEERLQYETRIAELTEIQTTSQLASMVETTKVDSPIQMQLKADLLKTQGELELVKQQLETTRQEHHEFKLMDDEIKTAEKKRFMTENTVLKQENNGLSAIIESMKVSEAKLVHDNQMLEAKQTGLQNEISNLRDKSICTLQKDSTIAQLTRDLKSTLKELDIVKHQLEEHETEYKKEAEKEIKLLTEHQEELKSQFLDVLSKASDAYSALSSADLAIQQHPLLGRVLDRLSEIEHEGLSLTWL